MTSHQSQTTEDRLARLFAGLYGEQDPALQTLPDEQVAGLLANIDVVADDPAAAVRAAGASLSVRQMGIIRLAREVLHDYFAQPVFHPHLARRLLAACGGVIADALPREGWLLRRQHPLHGLMALLEELARGWHPALPQAEEQASLMAGWLAALMPPEARLAEAQQWLTDFQQRQQRLGTRVAESESGVLRLTYVRQTAARSLNRLLAGRLMPEFMSESVASHWVDAFQWTLLHKGERSPLWQKLVRGFGLLVWSVQPEAADAGQRAKLTRVVDQVRSELLPLLDEIIADEGLRNQLAEQIEIAFLCQLNARPFDYRPVPPVAGGTALDDAGVGVSQDLLAEVAAVNPGDWFVEGESGRRLRLLVKLDEYQQLLFVNQLGIKELSASFEEFAWLFSSAQISALVAPVPLIEWSAERLNALAEQYRARQQSREQEHRTRLARQAEQDAQRERARQKALAEARQLAEQRQQQEDDARLLQQAEQEVEQARRESAAAAHGQTEAQRRQRARLLVSGLTMGAWLTFHDDTGTEVRRKLAVVLPSSGKYIFVDRLGTDKYEVSRDDLVAGIAAGAIDVVRKDSRFDDALNRVVDGIRQDRGWGHG